MSLIQHSNRRKRKNTGVIRNVDGANNFFFALNFISEKEKQINTSEIVDVNATVIIKDDNIILDYSHLHNKEDVNSIMLFFKSSVAENDIITIKNGQYLNEMTGDNTTYDISGTVTFKKFDENNKMVYAKIVSLENPSPNYSIYDYNFFISPLNWTTTSNYTEKEYVNQIINMVPSSSRNSFIKSFGNIDTGDILELSIDGSLHNFTIEKYTKSTNEIGEVVDVGETIPPDIVSANYIGTEIFGRLKRRINKRPVVINNDKKRLKHKKTRTQTIPTKKNTLTKVSAKTITSTNNTNDNITQSTYPSLRNPQTTTPLEYQLRTRTTREEENQTKLEESKRRHIISGSPTIYVKVELDKNGNEVYSFKHKDSPAGKKQDTLSFEVGKTYKFVQSHKSNGIYGFTNKEHPLSIGTCTGAGRKNCQMDSLLVRSEKQPGVNGSYLYFGPVTEKENLYTFCLNHTGMGGEINISGRSITAKRRTSSRNSTPRSDY